MAAGAQVKPLRGQGGRNAALQAARFRLTVGKGKGPVVGVGGATPAVGDAMIAASLDQNAEIPGFAKEIM